MDGKVVLITGAARGQGRAHALTMAREGADILALDCPVLKRCPYPTGTREDLQQTARDVEALGRRIIAREGDVRDQDALDGLVADGLSEFGHVDVLIANAGIWSLGDFWMLDDEQWDEVVDVCLKGAWRSAKAVAPHMIEREQGVMIFTASANGHEGAPRFAHYGAAKHGVLGLMKSLALELGPRYGIRCNAVLPGAINTPIMHFQECYDMMAGGPGGTREQLDEGGKVWGALKDVGLLPAQSIANAVLFLASDDASDITGLELLVDAGHRILPGLNTTAMAEAGSAHEMAEATA